VPLDVGVSGEAVVEDVENDTMFADMDDAGAIGEVFGGEPKDAGVLTVGEADAGTTGYSGLDLAPEAEGVEKLGGGDADGVGATVGKALTLGLGFDDRDPQAAGGQGTGQSRPDDAAADDDHIGVEGLGCWERGDRSRSQNGHGA
jgi:hypothetical protein